MRNAPAAYGGEGKQHAAPGAAPPSPRCLRRSKFATIIPHLLVSGNAVPEPRLRMRISLSIRRPHAFQKCGKRRHLPMHSAEQIGPHDLVVVSIGVSTKASTRARCGDFCDELVETCNKFTLIF
jgi:hypothetical protein